MKNIHFHKKYPPSHEIEFKVKVVFWVRTWNFKIISSYYLELIQYFFMKWVGRPSICKTCSQQLLRWIVKYRYNTLDSIRHNSRLQKLYKLVLAYIFFQFLFKVALTINFKTHSSLLYQSLFKITFITFLLWCNW